MSVETFTKTGNKAAPVRLNKDIFGLETANHDLLKQAYQAYLANRRTNTAKTLTRGLVRGGGKKPWKQKGTGRARFGSIRTPLWRGGGIIFGPTGNENYSISMPKRLKQAALKQALSISAKENKLNIIETFECKEGKVKPTIELLEKIGAKGNVLLIVSLKDELVQRATRNLPAVKAIQANYLNVFDLLNADTVLISKKALEILNNWLGNATGKAEAKNE